MRDDKGDLTFNPDLPARLTRLRFRLLFRGRRLRVDVTNTHATYALLEGAHLAIEIDAFAPSGPRRGPEATAPSRQTEAPRKRKQPEEYPMHYIADDLDMDAWVNAGLARLERYLACWRLFTELYPADAP